MGISSQHITGFALVVEVSAVGVYLHQKNQAKADKFLRNQGIICSLFRRERLYPYVTEGTVDPMLTSSSFHTHGIKMQLNRNQI